MALDPSIALSVKPVQINDPLEQYGKVMTLKGLVNQQQMQANQLQDYQRNREKQTKLSDLTSKYTRADENGIPTLDKKAYLSDLMTIDPETALDYGQKFQKQDADAAKMRREEEDAKLAQAIKHIETVGQLMNGVTDQASYDAAVAQGRALGLPGMDQVNPTYNPAEIEKARLQAMTVAEQLAYRQKERDAEYRAMNDERNRIAAEKRIETMARLGFGKNQLLDTEQGYVAYNPRTNKTEPVTDGGGTQLAPPKKATQPNKPQMPTAALKMQQEALDAIGNVGSINADLGAIQAQIDGGALQLGPIKNSVGTLKNLLGASNEQSRNYASFKASLEKLRNDSLRLNKGVQTDGDANRAWNELFQNINDEKAVKQRLIEISKINERAAALQQQNLTTLRENYGLPPIDTSSRFQQQPAISGGKNTPPKPQQPAPAPKGKPAAGVKFLGFE